jgi:D-alanine transaminase
MSRIAYVNGRYVRHAGAQVHIEDRGYQFADGVYEVILVRHGVLVDELPHLDRLERSLRELRIPAPMGRAALAAVLRETIRRNRVADGIVYLQVTRGVARRDHAFPKAPPKPALVVTAKRMLPRFRQYETGIAVITLPDTRWKRVDIKTVNLVANVLAKQQAIEAGVGDAWLVGDDGRVTEATASNAWIVNREREILTHVPDNTILNGITRLAVKALAQKHGYRVVERAFTRAEAYDAAEAFITGTTSWVTAVTRIDDKTIADGKPGPLTRALLAHYRAYAEAKP